MNSKLLSIIAVFIGILLPMKMQAQGVATDISAPEFTFEGDNLVMTCETQGASIYYVMAEYADDDEAYSLVDNLDISEANSMRTLYTAPFPVTKNVVIKAIAKMPQQQEESEVKTIIYSYTAWSELLEAIDYGSDVLTRAQNNPNVSDDLKENLQWAIEDGEHFYYQERGMMPDSYEAVMIRQHILEIAHEIEEILGPAQTDPEPYAVLSDNNTVLTFYYDTNRGAFQGSMDLSQEFPATQWMDYREQITRVVFDNSFANCTTIMSTNSWFTECKSLTTIEGIENLNTENVTDMGAMFLGCSALTSLDVSHFNTAKVTDMGWMFSDCSSLASLDVSHFNTANVTSMASMFGGCSNLTAFNLSNFNTVNVTNMLDMFNDCHTLTTLDLSSFNTANVTNMSGMFFGCSGLTTIFVSDAWSISNVSEGTEVFYECTNLVGGLGTKFSHEHIDYDYAHIDGGTANPGYFTAAGAEPWTEPEIEVVLTGKIDNFWYDETGNNPNGEEAVIFTIPETPDEGNSWDVNVLSTFVNNQLTFTTPDGESLNNITGQILFETRGNMVALDDGRVLMYEGENEQEEIAFAEPGMGMIRIYNSDITQRLLHEPNAKYMALPVSVRAYLNNEEVTVKNGSFTVLVQISQQAQGPEPYAVLSQNNTVLTFYYDDQKEARNGMGVGPFEYNYDEETQRSIISSGWDEQRESITSVAFDPSFENCTSIESTAYWFSQLNNLTTIRGIEHLNTQNVTDMHWMFEGCSSLTNLNVSTFNTENVRNMGALFGGCSGLTSLDVSNFNTSRVTDMNQMFSNCSGLTSLDLSSFNTANVQQMFGMFNACRNLTSLDLGNFDTRNVTRMDWMFDGCRNLTELNVSSFNTEKVEWIYLMFGGCSSLTHLDLSNFNTSNATEMREMFEDCSSLTSLDLSNFYTPNATTIGWFFRGCTNLVSVDIRNFTTDNIVVEDIFDGCSSLASIQAGNANIPAEEYAEIGNPNLLVYVNEPSLAPEGVQNVVINGQAREIILTDVTEGNNNWFCPEPFTAEKISYTRNFSQQTEVGISRGWESIALPFTVQDITHESKGRIIPFGAQGTGKYFWLRGYSPDGLHRATVLEANTPYVISMPNNPAVYPYEYNLNGRVTFSAENTTVPATPETWEMTITRDNIRMAPVFQLIPRNEMAYAINVGQPLDRYAEGSVFTRELREVRPFEAVTYHEPVNGARPQNIRIAPQSDDDITGIRTIELDETEGTWYSIDGRQLQGQPQRKGVYLQKGKKIVVK